MCMCVLALWWEACFWSRSPDWPQLPHVGDALHVLQALCRIRRELVCCKSHEDCVVWVQDSWDWDFVPLFSVSADLTSTKCTVRMWITSQNHCWAPAQSSSCCLSWSAGPLQCLLWANGLVGADQAQVVNVCSETCEVTFILLLSQAGFIP